MERNGPDVSPSRGLINQKMSMEHFDLFRIAPSDALSPFIENYWIVDWDLTGKPDYVQENLPHPSVNLVVDPMGQSGIFGVQRGKFTYRLSGSGRLFGAKFRPGAFYGFLDASVQTITDTYLPIERVFAESGEDIESKFLRGNDLTGFASQIETMLLRKKPALDDKAGEAWQLVELIRCDPTVMRVEDVAQLSLGGVRRLQRLFEAYVGVSPKWVIDRYRMLEAMDVLNSGASVDLTELALRLGYYDSAHFSGAFKALTGFAPSALLTSS